MSPTPPNGDAANVGAKRPGDPPNASPAGSAFSKSSSPSLSSRQSAVKPLAPLEFLQNHRRGSITDPSLHAGPNPPFHAGSSASSAVASPFRRPDSPATSFPSSAPRESRHSFSHSRPLSPYKFGDASSQPNESPSTNLRRLLRSPSADTDRRTPTQTMSVDSGREGGTPGAMERNGSGAGERAKGSDHMDVDVHEDVHHRSADSGGNARPGQGIRDHEDVDYSGRRESVVAGTKRKIPSDKRVYPPGNPDIDPQLVGPDGGREEEPAPKRRGSAIDTQRIAQLSLNDRRNSGDARVPWWPNDRRDSTSSASAYTNSNTPLTTGYTTPSSGIPGPDSPHGRPPGGIATFAWPANPHVPPDQAAHPSMQNEQAVNMQAPPPPYDPLTTIMPPVTFAPDRRMSAPNISPDSLPTPPSTGPTRALRSRSRPPSRVRTADQSASNGGTPGGNMNPEDASTSAHGSEKASGSTPYSRSPELRVSHKLAERKRRKEMKELFDELRDQLPADRGMKASKWEILSKAIDFVVNLKQSHQEMGREIEMLRHELEGYRQGMPPPFAGAPHTVVYGHGPPVGVPTYPPPPGAPGAPPPLQQPHTHSTGPQGPPPTGHPGPHHPHPLPPSQQPLSRPGSSQNAYPPGAGPSVGQPPTVNGNPPGSVRTDTPS